MADSTERTPSETPDSGRTGEHAQPDSSSTSSSVPVSAESSTDVSTQLHSVGSIGASSTGPDSNSASRSAPAGSTTGLSCPTAASSGKADSSSVASADSSSRTRQSVPIPKTDSPMLRGILSKTPAQTPPVASNAPASNLAASNPQLATMLKSPQSPGVPVRPRDMPSPLGQHGVQSQHKPRSPVKVRTGRSPSRASPRLAARQQRGNVDPNVHTPPVPAPEGSGKQLGSEKKAAATGVSATEEAKSPGRSEKRSAAEDEEESDKELFSPTKKFAADPRGKPPGKGGKK